ncbi:SGNH/GDSL hydrolase family protein [Streptomyces sp. NPDC087440]|uniref:SGNH/GDSL hydrolase family protein n=1 Tax=Streptomyces sp. NPDC087440 TaxID=3365790 RepID=UPI0037FCCD7F
MFDRRSLLRTAAFAAPALSLTTGTAAASVRPRTLAAAGGPLVYGVLGDSITGRGSFASRNDTAWTALLQARLAKDWQVTRVDGSTSRDAANLTCLATVNTIPFGCDLVVVGLGTNDCHEQRNGRYVYTPHDTRIAARGLFRAVAAANPCAVIVSLGVWGDRSVRWSVDDWTPPVSRVAYWDAIIAECCLESGGIPLSCADLYDTSAYRLPAGRQAFGGNVTDGFHPNDAGHGALYQRVANQLGLA